MTLSPPVNIFTDRSKAVLLLWIIFVIYVLCLSCIRVCSFLPCGDLLAYVCDVYFDFITSHTGVVLDYIDS